MFVTCPNVTSSRTLRRLVSFKCCVCRVLGQTGDLRSQSSVRGGDMALSHLENVLAWLFWLVVGLLFVLFRALSPRKFAPPGRKLMAVNNPLLLVSATQLAKKIRRREVRFGSNQGKTSAGHHNFRETMIIVCLELQTYAVICSYICFLTRFKVFISYYFTLVLR